MTNRLIALGNLDWSYLPAACFKAGHCMVPNPNKPRE